MLRGVKNPTRVSVFASELCKIAGYSCASVLTTSYFTVFAYGHLEIFLVVLAEERKLHAFIFVRFYKVQ